MVVAAIVRYGTSMSHISLPQTSVSVDSWVAKKSLRTITIELQVHLMMFAHLLFSYMLSDFDMIHEK